MTTHWLFRPASGVAAAAALALAACGAQPYPEPAAEPPPPPPSADLLGGPEAAPADSPAEAQAETPPPPVVDFPPPLAAAPPDAVPAPPSNAPAGPPPVVIAMAPIPNPPETSGAERPKAETRSAEAGPAQRRATPRRARTHRQARPAAAPASPPRPAVRLAESAPRPQPSKPRPAAPAPSPAGKPAAQAPAEPPTKAAGDLAGNGPAKATAARTPTPLSDHATRLAALEGALAESLSSSAELHAPTRFTAGRPEEVTLRVPSEFAQAMLQESAKNGLSDAARSTNLTAVLSADGFTVAPDAMQSRPLLAGQAVEFRWTVTPKANQPGPLRASVGADLLGSSGADMLNLGAVQARRPVGLFEPPRIYGVAMLAVLAILLVAWLVRGGGLGAPGPAARRAAARSRRAALAGEDEA